MRQLCYACGPKLHHENTVHMHKTEKCISAHKKTNNIFPETPTPPRLKHAVQPLLAKRIGKVHTSGFCSGNKFSNRNPDIIRSMPSGRCWKIQRDKLNLHHRHKRTQNLWSISIHPFLVIPYF